MAKLGWVRFFFPNHFKFTKHFDNIMVYEIAGYFYNCYTVVFIHCRFVVSCFLDNGTTFSLFTDVETN